MVLNKKYLYLTAFVVPIALLFLYPVRLSARYMPFSVISILILLWEWNPFRLRKAICIVMISLTVYMLSLPYDQIHREDYKGLFERMCLLGSVGLDPQWDYYIPSNFIRMKNANGEIHYLKVLNSQDSVNRRMDDEDKLLFPEYELVAPSVRWKNGLIGYSIWKRKESLWEKQK